MRAMAIAIIESNIDSMINCVMSWGRVAPMVFLRLISFALLLALAVERFIKFMQAISKMRMAISERKFTD
jgi:hypothetical protein